MTPERKKKITLWIISVAAACILIFLGVQNISAVADAVGWCFSLVSSLLVGVAFALVINVPMSFLESKLFPKAKKKILSAIRRPLAYLLSIIFILAVIAGVVWLVIPELIEAVTTLVDGGIKFINELLAMTDEEIMELPFGQVLINTDWDKILESMKEWLKNQGGVIVGTAVGTIGSLVDGIFDFFISFVFSIYILFSKEKLKKSASRTIRVWLPERFGESLIHAFTVLGKSFRNFVFGQSLEAVIIGVLCMLGMLLLGIPYAAPVGALVGVTALIPIVGSFIGAIVGAFLIVTVSPINALIFLIYLIILQQLEGNLIYPKVMGSKMNLPGMWILAAVTVGGGIAGPIGMLLSVPVASAIYVLFGEATDRREAKKAADVAEQSDKTDESPVEAGEEEKTENGEKCPADEQINE